MPFDVPGTSCRKNNTLNTVDTAAASAYNTYGHKNRGAERLRFVRVRVCMNPLPDPGNAGVGSFGAEMRNWETLARPQFADAPVFMLRHKKGFFSMATKSYSRTRTLVECALMIAVGTVLAQIKIFEMPFGGSVTLVSMLPFILVSFRHGVKWGLATGFVNSLFADAAGLLRASRRHCGRVCGRRSAGLRAGFHPAGPGGRYR